MDALHENGEVDWYIPSKKLTYWEWCKQEQGHDGTTREILPGISKTRLRNKWDARNVPVDNVDE